MAERNDKGQFIPGSGGGPGRPKRKTEQEYLDAVLGSVSIADMKAIAKKAVSQAMRGDARARQWVSDYVLGPAPQTLRHTGDEGGPILVEVTFSNAAETHINAATGD